MKALANVLFVIAVLLIIYSVLGKLIGLIALDFIVFKTFASTGLIMANSLMLIALFLRFAEK